MNYWNILNHRIISNYQIILNYQIISSKKMQYIGLLGPNFRLYQYYQMTKTN